MNGVDAASAQLTTQRIRSTIETVAALERRPLTTWRSRSAGKPFVWIATADAILDKVKRFCEDTLETRR
jgi:hypothetical protein